MISVCESGTSIISLIMFMFDRILLTKLSPCAWKVLNLENIRDILKYINNF